MVEGGEGGGVCDRFERVRVGGGTGSDEMGFQGVNAVQKNHAARPRRNNLGPNDKHLRPVPRK